MINSWTGFQPLKEVWLGGPWPSGWEEVIFTDTKDQENLRNITNVTKEQLNTFQRIMEDDGILVRRPCMPGPMEVFDNWQTYKDYFEDMFGLHVASTGNFEKFKKELGYYFKREDRKKHHLPEMNPRDNFIVYGQTLFVLLSYNKAMAWWGNTLHEYILNGYDVRFINTEHWMGLVPPSVVRLGKKVIIEEAVHETPQLVKLSGPDTFAKALSIQYNTDIHRSGYVDGRHSDGQFAVLRPGTALTSKSRTNLYKDTFPNWNFIQHKPEFDSLTQDELNEIETLRFVNKQIENWTGNISESFFDVNVLVRDEEHVYVSNKPPKPLGSDYTVIPWKYRWFWDGGLHCITLDIHREGNQENYFAS